ncbi:uncharacterized protein DUF2066 [Eilatimonas milleporae]|uniref:Uncharacterized protein DUF2066 n=2 Tax=Eilatimonas milleporae TaxID=911205 RepID=A0A3M0CIL2_9PROT|nr:uncharacterized protein DUF2066 [Eilatimonas milleporae]
MFRLMTMTVALLLVVGQKPADAQQPSDDSLYSVRGVRVDETARDASRARAVALAGAERRAYGILIAKLTRPQDRVQLPDMNESMIRRIIRGIDVIEEQSSGRRYRAILDIHFAPAMVSRFLADAGVPQVVGGGQGVLVLHAHGRGLEMGLWVADQIRDAARGDVDWGNRLRRYRFPVADISSRAAVTAAQVRAMDASNALRLRETYGVGDVLLIFTRWDKVSHSLAYEFLLSEEELSGSGRMISDPAASDAIAERETLALALGTVLERVDTDWREQLLVDMGEGGSLEVAVPSRSLDEWTAVRERLKTVQLVDSVATVSLRIPVSRLYFHFTGRYEQMRLALSYAGLRLDERDGDWWLIPVDGAGQDDARPE